MTSSNADWKSEAGSYSYHLLGVDIIYLVVQKKRRYEVSEEPNREKLHVSLQGNVTIVCSATQ